mmetsp:Transcript_61946/g.199764  ORF Transcript_61946/g.199764 Transcript_61946/m.199764 type:complete len:218 (-) Transcript_61946:30-683(-)
MLYASLRTQFSGPKPMAAKVAATLPTPPRNGASVLYAVWYIDHAFEVQDAGFVFTICFGIDGSSCTTTFTAESDEVLHGVGFGSRCPWATACPPTTTGRSSMPARESVLVANLSVNTKLPASTTADPRCSTVMLRGHCCPSLLASSSGVGAQRGDPLPPRSWRPWLPNLSNTKWPSFRSLIDTEEVAQPHLSTANASTHCSIKSLRHRRDVGGGERA